MNGRTVRIATRASRLALWQANWVRERLEALGRTVELVPIETQGDREMQAFALMQGQGFFTKAVQDALIDGRADVAVHSYKDLPSAGVPTLEIAAMTERADPRDVLLVRPDAFDASATALPLAQGARVGTSAARRQAQLRALRGDVAPQELRGNVQTRIGRLREGHYDAIMLAAAGIARLELDLAEFEVVPLEPDLFVPAPAQGVLALECRRDDWPLASLLTDLHDLASQRTVTAERGLMSMLQGGCQLALGAHARVVDGSVELLAWFEGTRVRVRHASPEGAAYEAYEMLGRPAPRDVAS